MLAQGDQGVQWDCNSYQFAFNFAPFPIFVTNHFASCNLDGSARCVIQKFQKFLSEP